MRIASIFTEEHRERRRRRLGRSRLADILWYSSSYDYRLLRVLLNLPVGVLVCLGVHELGWQRLNFAPPALPVHSAIFKWGMVGGGGLAFALSPILRTALICVVCGALGKAGQGVLGVFVMEQLHEGPLDNLLHNLELASRSVVCQLETQARTTAQRVTLASGPLETLLEQHFGKTTEVTRSLAHHLHALLAPFESELRADATEEDFVLAAEVDAAHALAQKAANEEEEENTVAPTEPPDPDPTPPTHNGISSRAMARRFERRCERMFAATARQCAQTATELQARCLESVPRLVGWLLCGHLVPTQMCPAQALLDGGHALCKSNNSDSSSDVGDGAQKLQQKLQDQLRIHLHVTAVLTSREERIRLIGEVKEKLQHDVGVLKAILRTSKEVLSALLVYLVYSLLRQVVAGIQAFLNDVNANNVYVTQYFRYLDEKRARAGHTPLLPLSRAMRMRHGLRQAYAPPSTAEVRAAWEPLVRWCVLCVCAGALVALDAYLYRVLALAHQFTSDTHTRQTGAHTLAVGVEGEGVVAELVRDLLAFNHSTELRHEHANDACAAAPSPPDWTRTALWVGVPLGAMLVLQVLFNFAVKRLVLFHVLPFMFPRRHKARVLQLYNQLLLSRENAYRIARARIRVGVRRRAYRRQHSSGLIFSEDCWLRRHVLDRFLCSVPCLVCGERFRRSAIKTCDTPECTATFCRVCFRECGDQCYACQAEQGLVDSSRTHKTLTNPAPAGNNNNGGVEEEVSKEGTSTNRQPPPQ